MANSAMDALKGILGDDADEKIQSVLGSLTSSGGDDGGNKEISNNIKNVIDTGTLDSVMQIKGMIDQLSNSKDDSRSNLLMSLRPFMRTNRQGSIDTAIKLLNLSKLSGLFKMR